MCIVPSCLNSSEFWCKFSSYNFLLLGKNAGLSSFRIAPYFFSRTSLEFTRRLSKLHLMHTGNMVMSLPAVIASFTKRALIIFSSWLSGFEQTLQARKSSGRASNSSSSTIASTYCSGYYATFAFYLCISFNRARDYFESLLAADLPVNLEL